VITVIGSAMPARTTTVPFEGAGDTASCGGTNPRLTVAHAAATLCASLAFATLLAFTAGCGNDRVDGARQTEGAIEIALPNGARVDTLAVGRQLQLSVTRRDGTKPGSAVRWSSNPVTVATVSSDGLVTAWAPGGATVEAVSESSADSVRIIVVVPQPQGPLPVFPGAVGFGTETPAGRGGAILRVTNLNDGGAGSLRAALTASGPRTVICEISGTIILSSRISISNPYLTFAGQTCPPPGLTLRRFGIRIRAHDVLIQHVRVRVGDEAGSGAGDDDAIEVLPGGYNIVVDHVSTSWATDEDWSTYYNGVHDVTFSNSITAENIGSGAVLIGDSTRNIAVIKMLFESNKDRHPFIKGETTTLVANNLFYNYLDYPATYFSDPDLLGPPEGTVVGNRYLPGPNSNRTGRPIMVTSNNRAGTKVYVADNSDGRTADPPSDPWSLVLNQFGPAVVATSPPVWPSGFAPLSNGDVYTTVLAKSGMCPNWRDAVDQRLIANVQNGTGSVISSQSQVGGWPALAVNTRPLTPPANPNGDDDGDGYTNLEEWLHSFYAACGGH
jgi:hypothetical protein